jgi:peptide-methionine (S)-S-oxide reductase
MVRLRLQIHRYCILLVTSFSLIAIMGNLFCFGSAEEHVSTTTSVNSEQDAPVVGDVWRVGFGAGCYWGTEKFIGHVFPQRSDKPNGSIIKGSGKVGFMGPKVAKSNPSYEDVCTGRTGHVEVYDLSFTGGAAYFEAMLKFFYMIHDPTTKDRQGNDRGTQYASVVYCYNQEQFDIATRVKDEVQALINSKHITVYSSVRVTTDIRHTKDASPFFEVRACVRVCMCVSLVLVTHSPSHHSPSFSQPHQAHKEHQDYLTANPSGYCNHGFKLTTWPQAS